MNCAEANQLNFVDYLYLLGHQPKKISNKDYWYLSPLRKEKKPSFKVNKTKNIWNDHGLVKGGTLVDFAIAYFHCNVSEALEKIFSFHTQKHPQNNVLRQTYHRHEKNEINEANAGETKIKIIAAKELIKDLMLWKYLAKRRIGTETANKYCRDVSFTIKDKNYKVIGFKNNAGGYELRNEYFECGSLPKYISYMANKANNISVFEGFLDFLSYQTIHQNQDQGLTNFLILNSLSFFERSVLLTGKYISIKLHLDNDKAGRIYTSLSHKRIFSIPG